MNTPIESWIPLTAGMLIVGVVTLAATQSGSALQSSRGSSDADEVKAVARDYIEGWYTGDVERMARALHVDLVKRMPIHDPAGGTELHPISRDQMLELTAQGGGKNPDAVVEILVDDVATDIATARVGSPEYLDYLHLARTPEGWKIVNVLFHRRD